MAAGKPGKSEATSALDSVHHLIAVADRDTVHRDLYLARAEVLLASTLSRQQFREARNTEQAIAAALGESRAATVRLDWARVEEQAQRADQLRRALAERAPVVALGAEVYEAPPTALDPFSPGLGQLAASDPFELRAAAVSALAALERADAEPRQLYGERRAYLEQLAVTARVADSPKVEADTMATADVAQRRARRRRARRCSRVGALCEGDARLGRRRRRARKRTSAPSTAVLSAPRCSSSVDLAAPSGRHRRPRQTRARCVGRLPAVGDGGIARIDQERNIEGRSVGGLVEGWEGASRVEAVSSAAGWPSDVSKAVRDLLDQFLRQVFVNSGGARYLPPFTTESILVEDFPEEGEAPSAGSLLTRRLPPPRPQPAGDHGASARPGHRPTSSLPAERVPPGMRAAGHLHARRPGCGLGWRCTGRTLDGYQVLSRRPARWSAAMRAGGLNDLADMVDDGATA
jgi:hypothetical protein